MSEWDALTASLSSLEQEFSGSGTSKKPSARTQQHTDEIDAILKSRGGKSAPRAAEAIDTAALNAEFDAIGLELTDEAVARNMWSADQSETVDRQFDDVAATMDALEVQDELLDDLSLANDAERDRLQATYRANIAKLTAEVDKIGAATAEMERGFQSKGGHARAATAATASSNDAGLLGALASVNSLLANTEAVKTSSDSGPDSRFTGPDNLPPEKLARLKASLKQGIAQLLQEFSSIKERVAATPDLGEAVALTAPLANVREDFQLLARLCERPGALPKLELASIGVYKTSVSRLVLAMKTSLELADRTVQSATPAQSTVVVRIARIVSSTRKTLNGEDRDK